MPNVFTPWRNAVEKACTPPKPLPAPAKGSLPLPSNTADLATAAWIGWDGLPETGPYLGDVNAEPSKNAEAPVGVLDFAGISRVARRRRSTACSTTSGTPTVSRTTSKHATVYMA